MIKQPEKGTRHINDNFYKEEERRIELLNQEFFQNIELTKRENDVLVWLCGWDNWTIETVVNILRKVRGIADVTVR